MNALRSSCTHMVGASSCSSSLPKGSIDFLHKAASLLPFLTDKQHENVRKIEGDYLSQRRVSLYIKEVFIRQRLLNTIVDTLKEYMSKGMLMEGISKYGIKL